MKLRPMSCINPRTRNAGQSVMSQTGTNFLPLRTLVSCSNVCLPRNNPTSPVAYMQTLCLSTTKRYASSCDSAPSTRSTFVKHTSPSAVTHLSVMLTFWGIGNNGGTSALTGTHRTSSSIIDATIRQIRPSHIGVNGKIRLSKKDLFINLIKYIITLKKS